MAQVAEHLSIKYEVLNSNPSTTQKRKALSLISSFDFFRVKIYKQL
jgi:hypothetical protein